MSAEDTLLSVDMLNEIKRKGIETIKQSPQWLEMLALSKNPDFLKTLETFWKHFFTKESQEEVPIKSERNVLDKVMSAFSNLRHGKDRGSILLQRFLKDHLLIYEYPELKVIPDTGIKVINGFIKVQVPGCASSHPDGEHYSDNFYIFFEHNLPGNQSFQELQIMHMVADSKNKIISFDKEKQNPAEGKYFATKQFQGNLKQFREYIAQRYGS